jgi:hypothetical protein
MFQHQPAFIVVAVVYGLRTPPCGRLPVTARSVNRLGE